MSLRTILPVLTAPFEINHGHNIFCIGSCFAEHMVQKLENAHFDITSSPFGIVFNTLSIAEQLTYILEQKQMVFEELVYFDHLFHSMLHHGSYSHRDPLVMLNNINHQIAESNNALKQADIVLITLGSSFFYRYIEYSTIVANCHRLPQDRFVKEQATIEEMVDALTKIMSRLLDMDTNKKMILTVSPVRYLRDGFIQNARSKAALLLCCEALEKKFNQVVYFPSYELLMDDLRDYRFTKEDMVHPTTQAIDYIWNYFGQVFFKPRTLLINEKLDRLNKKLNHRPLFLDHPSHKVLSEMTGKEMAQMKLDFPEVNFKFSNL